MANKSFSLIDEESRFGVRHIQVLLLFINCLLIYYTLTCASIGIVAMTNANTTNPDFPEFDWSTREKSYILSGNSWGAVGTKFLGGYLSSQYGTKQLLLVCTLLHAILSLLTPSAIMYGGWQLFFAGRFLQGMLNSVMLPCFYTHLAKWCQVDERNRFGGIVNAGIEFGTLLGISISGFVAASNLGWPGIFYIPGGIGLLWSILWAYFGANSPSQSRIISLAEKKKILVSLKDSVNDSNGKKPIPWKAIFTCVPFWALIVGRTSQAVGYFSLEQQMPTYIHGIFKLGIQENAIYSAAPYGLTFIFSFVFLITADVLTKRFYVRLSIVRKTYSSIASWSLAIALSVLGFLSKDDLATNITLLVIGYSMASAQVIGSCMNHIDLSPNYSGFLSGITYTFASLVGIVSPLLIGMFVPNDDDRSQWSVVFITISVILFFGNLFYIIFGKMEEQSWNEYQNKNAISPCATKVVTPPMMKVSAE